MPTFFALICYCIGGFDRHEFETRGEAVKWARQLAGPRDRVEIGYVGDPSGRLYVKDRGLLLPQP